MPRFNTGKSSMDKLFDRLTLPLAQPYRLHRLLITFVEERLILFGGLSDPEGWRWRCGSGELRGYLPHHVWADGEGEPQ